MTNPTATSEPMTARERDLKFQHFENWREDQNRQRREKEELYAAISELQHHLANMERRLDDLDAHLQEASE